MGILDDIIGAVGSGLGSAGEFVGGLLPDLGGAGTAAAGAAPVLAEAATTAAPSLSEELLGAALSPEGLASLIGGSLGAVQQGFAFPVQEEQIKIAQAQQESLNKQREFERAFALLQEQRAGQQDVTAAAANVRGLPELVVQALQEQGRQTRGVGQDTAANFNQIASNIIAALR